MKKIYFLSFIFLYSILLGQNGITITPSNPSAGDTITIIFDPSQNSEMPDNINQCVLHWGYNGWQTPPAQYWPPNSVLHSDNVAVRSPFIKDGKVFKIQIPTSAEFEELDFVVNDGTPSNPGNNWAHNGSADWIIKIISKWEPVSPTHNDSITIKIKYSGKKAYLHWGINADRHHWTTPITDYWPEGSFLWSDNVAIETPFIGPDSNGYLNIKIGPFNNHKQLVQTIDFVIRYEDNIWDNNDNNDYHINLSFDKVQNGPEIVITSPDSMATVHNPLHIITNSNNADSIYIYFDDKLVYSGDDKTFDNQIEIDTTMPGQHILYAMAKNISNNLVHFCFRPVYIFPDMIYKNFEYSFLGSKVINDSVYFAIYAPGKHFVNLVIDDNDTLTMYIDTLKNIFWYGTKLNNGEHYYYYFVDGSIKIADPYSKYVRWVYSQNYQSSNPQDARTILTIPQIQYNWSDQDFQRPPLNEIIIYEIYTADFSKSKNFNGIKEKLSYLKELGVNAIELMPIFEFPGGSSWGYNPAFYFAPEFVYGTPEELKDLINEAHNYGIAVILDIVFNHSDGTSPMYQLYENPSGHDWGNDPYYHNLSNDWGMPDFDHTKPAMKQFIKDVLQYWITEYHIDGFRYDHTSGFYEYQNTGLYIPNVDDFTFFVDSLDSTIYQIAEEDNPSWPKVSKMDACWHFRFYHNLFINLNQINNNSSEHYGYSWGDMTKFISAISANDTKAWPFSGYKQIYSPINYIESHDEQRIIYEAITYHNIDYNTAIQKSKLGFAILMAAQGTPMLYHGQEFGMDKEKIVGEQPLQWDYLNNNVNKDLFETYKKLIALRKNSMPLKYGSILALLKDDNKKVAIWERAFNDEYIITAINLNTKDETINIPLPYSGMWYMPINNDSIIATQDTIKNYLLTSNQFLILSSTKIQTKIEEQNQPPNKIYHDNYITNMPNPFNNFTKIKIKIKNKEKIKLDIYNIFGQKIKTLYNGYINQGIHTFIWKADSNNGSKVASGIYFIKLQSEKITKTHKILLLK